MARHDVMPYKKLTIQTQNRVGYLTMASGSRFNKLTINMLGELRRAVAELAANQQVSCIVLSGYPGESFAVGADIGQLRRFGPAEAFSFAELGQGLFADMEQCEKPIIGALNGIAMGGGCDLALACDIRLASDSLAIAHPGGKIGILTGFCGTQKLPRLVGRNNAREIFLTTDTYDAASALRMGLVDRVLPAAEFWPAVVAYAERIARQPLPALAAAKRLVNASQDVDLKNGCLLEQATVTALAAVSTT